MRDSDWSRQILLRSDWLLPRVALITTILVFTDLFKIFHSKTNPVAGLG